MKPNITLVTGLYDMGRDKLDSSFSRDFQFYLDKFKELLESTADLPMIIFTENKVVPLIKETRKEENTQILERSSQQFRDWFEFSTLVKHLRERPEWAKQASWLEESPQAKLDLYLPFVLAKMFMMSDASITNPFNTEYFLWLDAGITNTVHKGYFSHDKILHKLETFLDPFLFLAFPYATGPEIHGFNRSALNKYCEVPNVEFVCRGGMFGGNKETIQKFNSLYYSLLASTLHAGFLGTEESLFTVLGYRYPMDINLFMLQEYGMISNFCEAVKTGVGSFVDVSSIRPKIPFTQDIVVTTLGHKEETSVLESPPEPKMEIQRPLARRDPISSLAVYCMTFNFPEQLRHTLTTIKSAYPEFFGKPSWTLLDNSTSEEAKKENLEIAKEFGFRVESYGNLGICSGRQWVAEDFAKHPEFQTMIFFEDDMGLCGKHTPPCRSGFQRYIPGLLRKSLSILALENLDFLKLNFSEFFGNNDKAWAWCNVPAELLPELFPEQPEKLDTSFIPFTRFSSIRTFEELPYALGLVHYCNWPILLTQEGSRKIYLDPVFRFPHESTIMSHSYQRQIRGEILGGVLLASPVEHHRFHHYPSEERIECL